MKHKDKMTKAENSRTTTRLNLKIEMIHRPIYITVSQLQVSDLPHSFVVQ